MVANKFKSSLAYRRKMFEIKCFKNSMQLKKNRINAQKMKNATNELLKFFQFFVFVFTK